MAPDHPPPAAMQARPPCADRISGAGNDQAPVTEHATSKLICRVRPCDKPWQAVSVLEREARIDICPERHQPGEQLRFDHVLHSSDSRREQEELFELVRPGILGCLEGGTCTVAAHGGPSSGKSYTLSGYFTHTEFHGLAPRAIRLIGDVMQNGHSSVVAVESSFFEIHHDEAYDLVKGGYQKVGLHELAEPPYFALDKTLSSLRCDKGGNRLLDTYFTGLEHRRKGSHTCFQVAFVHADGRRSFLRFVEIAWSRPQPAAGPGAPGRPGAQGPVQCRASAALEQVLHCKLSSSASSDLLASAYRASPLALLLKPGLEGAGVLYFVHCLRLEQHQMPCLVPAAPLLSRLHLWLALARGAPPPAAAARRRAAPSVPPLRLLGGGDGGAGDCRPAVPNLDDAGSSVSVSSTSSCGDSSRQAGEGARAEPADGGPDGGAGSSLVQSLTASTAQSAVVSQPEAGRHSEQSSGEAALDAWLFHQCSDLVVHKQHSIQSLRADADRSTDVLRGIYDILDQLQKQRHAVEVGPTEKETNLKILYEKVYRSLQRTLKELQEVQEDVDMLTQCCGGSILTAHDSCNSKQDTADNSYDAMEFGAGVDVRPHAVAATGLGKAGRAKAGFVVPQLPLDQLPQEHVPLQASAWQSSMPGPVMQHAEPFQANDRHGQPAVAPHHGFVSPPLPAQWARSLDDVREADEAEEDVNHHAAGMPYLQTAIRGCSLLAQPASVPSAGATVCPVPSEVIVADGAADGHRMQKSQSTASLRSVGPRCVVTTAVAPPVAAVGSHASPLPASRSDLAGGSPLRGGSLTSSGLALAAASGRGVASPPPPLPPRRPVTAGPVAAAARPAAAAPQRPCKPRAATPGARPGGAPPQSYSPMALGRTVSTQGLRFERTSPALKVRPSAAAPGRSASPDPARIALAASPMHSAVARQPGSPPVGTPSLAFRSCIAAPAPALDLQANASFSLPA